MNPSDWIVLASMLTVQAAAIVGYMLRLESRLSRLETTAEAAFGRRVAFGRAWRDLERGDGGPAP